MPQRCADVFAWRRTFMSLAGPPPITRLVLEGMSLFMVTQSGGCCWLSVRRLGEISGLDKGTVSKHRTLAVAAGWLIAESNPRHRQCSKFFAAVPDGVSIFQPTGATRRAPAARPGSMVGGNPLMLSSELSVGRVQSAFHSLSAGSVQSPNKLYGLRVRTVRCEPTNCTSPPDQSYIPINDLTKAPSDAFTASTFVSERKPAEEEAVRERLAVWIGSDGFAQVNHHIPELLVKLTPPNCRFPGYEALIQQATERTRK
jgi:hypothetical protein